MILIWDNGGAYSDHAVRFLDCGPWGVDDCVAMAKVRDSEGYVIAVAESLDWRQPAELQPITAVTPFDDESYKTLRESVSPDFFTAMVRSDIERLRSFEAHDDTHRKRLDESVSKLEALL
jgi:hypothetical protein